MDKQREEQRQNSERTTHESFTQSDGPMATHMGQRNGFLLDRALRHSSCSGPPALSGPGRRLGLSVAALPWPYLVKVHKDKKKDLFAIDRTHRS